MVAPWYIVKLRRQDDHMRGWQNIGSLHTGLLHVAAALVHDRMRPDGCRSERLTSNAMYLCSRASCGESITPWLVQTPQMQKMGDAVQEVASDVGRRA